MKRNYERLKCRTLLKLAPKLKGAYTELKTRAGNWDTCAVGEAASRLKVSRFDLFDKNPTIFHLGFDFLVEVEARQFDEAKKIYNRIDRLTKALKL